MARIVMIEKDGGTFFVTDDPDLEVYGVSSPEEGVWNEVYRRGPSVDRVSPIVIDRILGNADEIGHYGDMADILERPGRPRRKTKTRKTARHVGTPINGDE